MRSQYFFSGKYAACEVKLRRTEFSPEIELSTRNSEGSAVKSFVKHERSQAPARRAASVKFLPIEMQSFRAGDCLSSTDSRHRVLERNVRRKARATQFEYSIRQLYPGKGKLPFDIPEMILKLILLNYLLTNMLACVLPARHFCPFCTSV